MTGYEVEFGAITERRDAKTRATFGVDVEVYVQRTETAAAVEDAANGTTRSRSRSKTVARRSTNCPGSRSTTSLVAVRTAAHEIDDLQDDYEVPDPVAAVTEREYEVFDQLSRTADD